MQDRSTAIEMGFKLRRNRRDVALPYKAIYLIVSQNLALRLVNAPLFCAV
jgi:hypothetical protein